MKSCDEMVSSLLKRRDQYIIKQKKKRKIIICTLSSLCFIVLLGFHMRPKEVIDDNLYPKTQETFNENHSSVDMSHHPNNYISDGKELTMISSFDEVPSSYSYDVPKDGQFYCSEPLKAAMNKYGDDVLYRVLIDVFYHQEMLSSDSDLREESERLSFKGYTVAYETYFDGTSYHYYLTLHAKYNELIEFQANENYGYFLFLYDERISPN